MILAESEYISHWKQNKFHVSLLQQVLVLVTIIAEGVEVGFSMMLAYKEMKKDSVSLDKFGLWVIGRAQQTLMSCWLAS